MYDKMLIGSRLLEIKRTLDLIMFTFETNLDAQIFIHSQCFLRIFKSDELILTNEKLYIPNEKFKKRLFKKFKWTKVGQTLFDEVIEINKQLINAKVLSTVCNNKDLKVYLDNEFSIEFLANVTKYDEVKYSENYRIFADDGNKEEYIV